MNRKRVKWIVVLTVVLTLLPLTGFGAKKKPGIVGGEILNFTLPSTHDRVINYADEYYGKHYLVMTFFPAAYTPL
jgi:hypothetical protein